MKGKRITRTLKVNAKPKSGKKNMARIRKMSEADLDANALSDEDNLPLTKKQLMQFRPARHTQHVDVKSIREKLKLSQELFARYFGVSVRTLQDWEQHRHEPSNTARNFLLVVAKEPKAVQRALS